MKGLFGSPGGTIDLSTVPGHLQPASAHLRDWNGQDPYFCRDGFLFHPHTGLTYSLNPTGALIYEALAAHVGFDEIVTRLTATFEVDIATARTDLADFLQQMRSLGLS